MGASDDIAVLARWQQSHDNWAEVVAVFAFHHQSLVQACVRLTYDPNRQPRYDGDTGAELYQETAMQLIHKLRIGSLNIHTSFYDYFVQAARNLWINRRKRSAREQPLDPHAQFFAKSGYACGLEEQEDEVRLAEGLNSLDDQTRQATILRHGENLPLRDVADQTKLSISGAKKRADKGLEKLRAFFKRD